MVLDEQRSDRDEVKSVSLDGGMVHKSVQIVDWYHARQHLNQAGQALYGGEAERVKSWQEEMERALYRGQIEQITQPLEAAGLSDKAHYFDTHQRRMQYWRFREEGYAIGSGGVESGVKQFKARLCGAGMRWSWAGAQRMLTLRASLLSDTLETAWRQICPPERAVQRPVM